ncbi:MAG: hypothetical protein ACI94Y_003710 [Maribacter sp.]|jgi:hypothetical protein
MEPLKEFLHINLQWEKDLYKKKIWNLKFDNDTLVSIHQGGWFFSRFQFVEAECGSWRVKKFGKEPYLFEFKKKNLVGKKEFEVGFKKRYSLGMFNPTKVDSFNWKALEGNAKGMGWYADGLEVVRFEKMGRSMSKFNYHTSIVNGRIEERWLAAMLVTGFMALR